MNIQDSNIAVNEQDVLTTMTEKRHRKNNNSNNERRKQAKLSPSEMQERNEWLIKLEETGDLDRCVVLRREHQRNTFNIEIVVDQSVLL